MADGLRVGEWLRGARRLGRAHVSVRRSVNLIVSLVLLTAGLVATEVVDSPRVAGATGTSSIGDLVFEDFSGDGSVDAGEPGRAGVLVRLVEAGSDSQLGTGDDVVFPPTLSGAAGEFGFTGLDVGLYRVSVVPPPGFSATSATSVDVTLSAAQSYDTADFGVVQGDASIGDSVYDDADGNGVRNGAESGVSGVDLTLKENGSTVATTTSASDGSYSFANLGAGSYTVTATVPAGSSLTTLQNPFPVELGAGEHYTTAAFGIRNVGGFIGDAAFVDLNANGTADTGEPPLANLQVDLQLGGSTIATTRADLAGVYAFENLAAGSYTVVPTAPPGATLTTGNSAAPVTLSAGQVVSTVDFGYSNVSMVPGAVTTLAGDGATTTVDGTGSGASFTDLGGVAISGANAYVFTRGSIRKVGLADGVVTTLAGHATDTGCTDSTTASSVRFGSGSPAGMTTDGTYLYVADCSNIRKVTIATGATSTLASSVSSVKHLTYQNGYVYASSNASNPGTILRLDASTGAQTTFATLPAVSGYTYSYAGPITSDSSSLYVIEKSFSSGPETHSILQIDLSTAAISTVATGDDVGGRDCACPDTGSLVAVGDYLYGASGQGYSTLRRWTIADGSVALVAGADIYHGASATEYQDGVGAEAWLKSTITGIASDGTRIVVADSGNHRLRTVLPAAPASSEQSATVTQTVEMSAAAAVTFAGDGTDATTDGIGPSAQFRDMGNAVVVGDSAYVGTLNSIRRVNLNTGVVTTLAGSPVTPTGCTDSPNPASVRFSGGEDGQLTSDGTFLYLADRTCHRIRRISIATGATASIASLTNVRYVTMGPDGSLYAGASGAFSGGLIYRVDPATGIMTTFKAFNSADIVGALAADDQYLWAVFIPSSGSGSSLIKIEFSSGTVTTVASGLPCCDIDRDTLTSAGDHLYSAAGPYQTALRRFAKSDGTYVDIAGIDTGLGGYAEDVGSAARFKQIHGIASDGERLWINDSGNHRFRVVDDLEFFDPQSAAFGFDEYGAWDEDVNVGLGNYVTSETDVTVAGVGPELGVTRTYNSLDSRIGAFGQGWSFNYDMTWQADASGNVAIIYPDGRREVHTLSGGSFSPPPSYYSKLESNGSGGYTLTQKDGQVVAFNAAGKATSITDPNGHAVTLAYDGNGNLSTATSSPGGRALTFTWSGGRIIEVSTQSVAAYGHALAWDFTYSGGSLTKVCNPRDTGTDPPFCTTYSYTVGRLSTITKPAGNASVEVHYGADGKVDWRKDGLGHLTRILYPSPGVVRVVDPRGGVTQREYNTTTFAETKETDASGAVTSYQYDGAGNRDEITDPNLGVTGFVFDAHRNVTEQADAEGNISYFTYDTDDNLTAVRDPRSGSSSDTTYKTVLTYDSARNKLTQTSPPTSDFPSGTTVTWTYTNGTESAIGGGTMPAGLVRTETDARSGVTTNSYDSKGDLRRVVNRAGLQADYTYDELGRRLTETQTSDTFPAGVTTTTTYDELNQPLTVTGASVTNEVTSSDHRLRVTNIYDANKNRISTASQDLDGSDPARTTTYEFDNNDQEIAATDTESGRMTRVFDPSGNTILVTDQNGHSRETVYDTRNLAVFQISRNVVDDPLAPTSPRTVTDHTFTYDAARRQVTDTDALGRQRAFTYDKVNRPTKVELVGYHNPDTSTRTITLNQRTYDPAGQVLTDTTGNGLRTVTNSWDAARRLTSTTLDPGSSPHLNRTTSYTFDANGNITKTVLTNGTRTDETRHTFNADDRITSRTVEYSTGDDLTTTYTYDQRGLLTATTDPRGNATGATAADYTTEYTNDEFGRPTTVTAPSVSVETNGGTASTAHPTTTYGYNTFGDRTHQTDPRGNTTTTAYDVLGRRTAITHPAYNVPTGGTLTPTETFDYDPVGNLTAQTDRRGQTTDYVFDTLNRVVRQVDPLITGESGRGTIATEWDDAGNQIAAVDQNGARTETGYDDLDRPRTLSTIVRQPSTHTVTTSYDYDDLGNQTLTTDPLGHSQLATYNAASEVTASVDALAKTTTYSYDVAGRRTTTTDPMNLQLVNTYDNAGRRASEIKRKTGSADIVTSYSYDNAANITTRTSPRGYDTTYSYDALNRLREIVEPKGAGKTITTSYGYDEVGNPTRYTDGRDNDTIATYQPWNLRESIIEPSTSAYPNLADRTYTNSYDAGGLTVDVALPGGVSRGRDFDELGRLTTETGIEPGQSNITRSFGYDLVGRETSASHPNGTIALAWDDRSLLLGASGGAGSSSFVYDDAARMTSRTDDAGTTSFTWTNRDELTTETDPLTGSTRTNAWDDAGYLATVAYTGGETRSYAYDAYHRLTGDTLKDSSNATLAAINYGYDKSSNITAKTTTLTGNSGAGTNSYRYDRKERLYEWTGPGSVVTTYAWDKANNRTEINGATFTYDDRNRLKTAPGGIAYTYTARGTRASQTDASTTTTYTYNAFDELTDYDGQVDYTYDAYGRIATRDTTDFSYAGQELDPVTTSTTDTYAHSPTGDLIAYSDGTNDRIVGRDQHGDLTWLLDDSTETVTDTRTYNPFGDPIDATGSLTPPVGYQSDYTDPTSDLVDMGTRWYEPTTANFLSRDTITPMLRTPVSLNMYTYAQNSPLNYFDPDGHWGIGDAIGSVCKSCQKVYDATVGRGVKWTSKKAKQAAGFVYDTARSAARWADQHIAQPAGRYARSATQHVSAAAQRSYNFIKGGVTGLTKVGLRAAQAGIAFANRAGSGLASAVSSGWNRCISSSGCRTFLGAAAIVGGTAICAATVGAGCVGAVAAGALIGGGIGGAVGVATCRGDTSCILHSVGMGALGGAAAGLGAGAFAGVSAGLAGAAGGLLGEGFNQLAAGKFNAARLAIAAGAGTVLAVGGSRAAQLLRRGGTAESTAATNKVAATGDDLLKPGPWATDSVPASAPGKITQAERDLLNPIGDASGCHSCGAPSPGIKSGNWIGDHQPVSRTVTPGTPQVLYPHCQACSNDQGLWVINLIRQGKLQ